MRDLLEETLEQEEARKWLLDAVLEELTRREVTDIFVAGDLLLSGVADADVAAATDPAPVISRRRFEAGRWAGCIRPTRPANARQISRSNAS